MQLLHLYGCGQLINMAHGHDKEEKLKFILASEALFKERIGTKLLPRVLRETERIWLLLLSPVVPRILLKRLTYQL